jgi:hypothetical protein
VNSPRHQPSNRACHGLTLGALPGFDHDNGQNPVGVGVRSKARIDTSRLCVLVVGLAVVGMSPPAAAVDLDGLVEAWTRTEAGAGGNDGVDQALGVAFDADDNVIAVGYLDGAAGHGTDGYALAVTPGGATLWDLVLDAGEIGVDRTSSDDRYNAVSVEPINGSLALCGAVGPADLDDPTTRYWVEALTPSLGAPPVQDWVFAYVDGAASPNQACQGADFAIGRVLSTGWGDHGVDVGRWLTWELAEATGAASPPVTYEYSVFEAVPDRAWSVAQDASTGAYAVAGTRGFAGLAGSLQNDTDAHVRYYNQYDALVWSDTIAGDSDLDDQFLAVAIDPLTHDVFAVGHRNEGDDNAGLADLDWIVNCYDDADPEGDGIPLVLWSESWSSAPGASEGATAVALDEGGDVLVGGWTVDAGSGLRRWRVARHSGTYGTLIQEWLGPVRAGDSWVTSVAFDQGRLAVAGVIDEGAGLDFAVTLLDQDLDEDGVADSVDACPDDPDKAADTGICGCNTPDIDTDGDGVENCIESCPTNPDKTEPGVCGCEEPDDDTDADGAFDCDDRCPENPDKIDDVGVCGCDAPDDDTDGDGVVGCRDACNNTPPGAAVNEFGCPLDGGTDETGDTGAPPSTDQDPKSGCGCATKLGTPAPLGSLALLALAAMVATRRRSGALRFSSEGPTLRL